jgi:two-component system chemotaxis response regulator CheY
MEPAKRGGAPETASPRATRPLNILIVDDSATMRAMIRRVSAVTGIPIGAVYEAANGRDAMAVLETHEVDALFTDLNMPIMTGTELLRAIEHDARFERLARVVISTDGSASRRAEVDDLHVRLYVEKPFRPEVMRDVLCQLASDINAR